MRSLGNYTLVKPEYLWIPDHAGTFGYEAIDLCKQAGWEFDPEQELALNAFMIHDSHGKWAANELAIVEARQNGKTNRVLIPRALWQLYLGPPDTVIWTAHRFVTSAQAFTDIRQLIEGCYDLRKRVKSIAESSGKEQIILTNGARIKFLARSKGGGRGLGGPLPVLDEAFAIEEGQLGALLPTILARPDSQIMYGSSAGLAESAVLRELRDRGRARNEPKLVYIEWCAPGSWEKPGCQLEKCDHYRTRPGCSLDNQKYWEVANPALDRRILRSTVHTLRRSLTPLQFGREVMTWWDLEPNRDTQLPIKSADWELCKDEESSIEGRIAVAVDVAMDAEYASIAICGLNTDGIPHAELIRYAEGIDWVPEELLRIKKKYKLHNINVAQGRDRDKPGHKMLVPAIILEPSGPASALLPVLAKEATSIKPVLMTISNLGQAFVTLQTDVLAHGKKFVHIGQHQVDLALFGGIRRNVGDGLWAIGRKKSGDEQVDVSPANAVGAARWGLLVAEPPMTGTPNVYIL